VQAPPVDFGVALHAAPHTPSLPPPYSYIKFIGVWRETGDTLNGILCLSQVPCLLPQIQGIIVITAFHPPKSTFQSCTDKCLPMAISPPFHQYLYCRSTAPSEITGPLDSNNLSRQE
jgi:hypothetical protein